MAKRGRRPRAARREAERSVRRSIDDRSRLAALAPGGSPGRPIELPSAAVVEVRARAIPCPLCDGELAVEQHEAEVGLRVVRTRCRTCHVPRDLWFRLPAGPN